MIIIRYPREKKQSEAFESSVGQINLIILLECTTDTLVERLLKRERSDDKEEAIRNRIDIFKKKCDEILYLHPTITKRVFI